LSATQKMAYIFLSISMLLFIAAIAHAHNPVIVKKDSSKEKPVLIEKPEISYAYYGELAGEPHYYKIVSPKPFTLYVNILVPDYSPKTDPIMRHDMSFQVLKDDTVIFTAEGMNSDWHRFYEEYGKDHYYMGPEFEQKADAGTYYVKVYNKNNDGKYSLATGKEEKFGFFGIIKAFFRARSLDKWFFKP